MAKRKLNPRDASEADVALGKRIRALREERSMSQTILGDALGVSFQQIQKYEGGQNRVSASRLQQIARVFKVELADFYDSPSKGGIDSLLFSNNDALSLQLLRAFARVSNIDAKHRFVVLVEALAGADD